MNLTVIIVNYNTQDLLKNCLDSIFKDKNHSNFKVCVVDNASVDDSIGIVKKNFPQVSIIQSEKNLGFAGGNNLALKKLSTKYALLLNSDTIVGEGVFDKLIDFAEKGSYGIVSCKLINLNGSFQANAGDLPFFQAIFFWISGLDDLPVVGSILPSFHKKNISEGVVGWVSGTAMLISSEVTGKIGLLDEALFMYAEDTDYCFRAKKAGFKIGWSKDAQITHLGGGSSDNPSFRQWSGEFKGLVYIYKKYFGLFPSYLLKFLFYLFILIRIIVFTFLGKFNKSKVYAKVLFNI